MREKFKSTLAAVGAFLLLSCAAGANDEFRGLWIDAFGAGFKTPSQVNQLIANAQAGNFNVILPQVRKRGDAYYNSNIEPKATDINQSYDPLADLIAKAHAANPPIEVHAWIVVYPIWNNQNTPPSQSSHVFNTNPEWLTEDINGNLWDGGNYQLDPGHPGAANHNFEVAMDIVTNYNVDGLHLDYIRYRGNAWGYNPVAVQRFNTLYNRSGIPNTSNSAWRQFRRDQVTELVRKTYLSILEVDPSVNFSAATITWGGGITQTSHWTSSSAYASVLQDWRAWMEEGILDLNIPMVYYNHDNHASFYSDWNIFIKNHKYGRHAAIGIGHYLNSISNSLIQMSIARQATGQNNTVDGIASYSYRSHNNEGASRAQFLAALTAPPSAGAEYIVDNSDAGFNASSAWNTSTFGTQKFGPNYRWRYTESTSDAAEWNVSVTEAGDYEIFAWWTQGGNRATSAPYIVDHAGGSTVVNMNQQQNGGQWNSLGVFSLNAGNNRVRLSCWTGSGTVVIADAVRWQQFGGGQGGPYADAAAVPVMPWKTNPAKGHLKGFVTVGGQDADGATVTLTGPENRQTTTDGTGFYGFANLAPGSYSVSVSSGGGSDSANVNVTAGTVGHVDLSIAGDVIVIVDNADSGFSASTNWVLADWASDKYGPDYRWRNTASVSDAATWSASLPLTGDYRVYAWWTAWSNRATSAPYIVDHSGGSTVVHQDQTQNGGKWNYLGTFSMNAGPNTVRLSCWTSSGDVVIADAIRWVKD